MLSESEPSTSKSGSGETASDLILAQHMAVFRFSLLAKLSSSLPKPFPWCCSSTTGLYWVFVVVRDKLHQGTTRPLQRITLKDSDRNLQNDKKVIVVTKGNFE